MIGVALASLAGVAPASATVVAPGADQVFEFSGVCSDCTGIGTGELTLSSTYTLGAPVTKANFISFHYDGTDLQDEFTIANSDVASIGGSIMPGPADFHVYNSEQFGFRSLLNGSWFIGYTTPADFGPNGSFGIASSVPEPATWALMAVGFAALGLAGSRARKTIRA